MEVFLSNPQFQIIFQLLLAAFLGGFIGLERQYKRKAAGLRTYSLVALGAALFTILGIEVSNAYANRLDLSFDPSRVIGQIVLGVGFLGAGLIVIREARVEGLTTAAGLWISAALGAAVGIKLYFVAIFVAFLTLGILSGLRIFEEKIIDKESPPDTEF